VPDPYPNARYRPSQLAADMMAKHYIDVNDAIYVVRNYNESWAGWKPGQFWYRGSTQYGRPLKVLIDPNTQTDVSIVTVHEISGGG
jgi:hypothetical protein